MQKCDILLSRKGLTNTNGHFHRHPRLPRARRRIARHALRAPEVTVRNLVFFKYCVSIKYLWCI